MDSEFGSGRAVRLRRCNNFLARFVIYYNFEVVRSRSFDFWSVFSVMSPLAFGFTVGCRRWSPTYLDVMVSEP